MCYGGAGAEPASQQAFTFLILGLHEDSESAQRLLADRPVWLDDALEIWSGLLQPLRHHGAANYLDRANPGLLFDAFAYGHGSHRRQLDRHRAENLADRTSFTRFRVLHSAGTWYGEKPAVRASAS